jgi:DNA-binding beta-propeller fold protein YncE
LSIPDDGKTLDVIGVDSVKKGKTVNRKKLVDSIDLATGQVTSSNQAISEEEANKWYQSLGEFPQERHDGLDWQLAVGKGQVVLTDKAQGEVLKTWEECDVRYAGDIYTIIASFVDSQGKTLLVSYGGAWLIRVTQLETGVDLGLFPTPIDLPRAIRFSRDGKQLYVLGYGTLQILDLSKRITDDKKVHVRYPLICVWPEDLPQ